MNFIHFPPHNPVFDPRFALCNLNPIHIHVYLLVSGEKNMKEFNF